MLFTFYYIIFSFENRPLHFQAGCHKMQLNFGFSVVSVGFSVI